MDRFEEQARYREDELTPALGKAFTMLIFGGVVSIGLPSGKSQSNGVEPDQLA